MTLEETKNSGQLSLIVLNKDTAEATNTNKTAKARGVDLSLSSPSSSSSTAALSCVDTRLNKVTATSKANDNPSANKSRPSLWYAIYFPQLNNLDDLQQKEALTKLASKAQSVSSTVSFHELALVCEIRSSINYFGGINSLHNKLKDALSTALIAMGQPERFFYAASPTVSGSLLLARAGQNTLVYQKSNLRSALGTLSTDVLNLSKEQNRRLYNMGIRSLKDIWRLPTDGIRKRFGSEFVNQLNKALGKAQEPTLNYLPPPTFSSSYDLPYELENLDRLLPIVDEIIGQLCDFLTRRDLSTSHLVFSLFHEKRSPTCIEISLRQTSRSSTHFLLLIETYFHNLAIPAAVISISLDVKHFDAFISHTDALLLDGKPDVASRDSNLNQFMEQLKARLGDNYLKSISCVAQHRPEYASTSLDFNGQSNTSSFRKNTQDKIAIRPRPIWLLEEPEELVEKNNRLYHRKAISIISGPERIETAWWEDHDVRRDYYIAQEGNGSRLWIYRERSGERRWLLHGYFS
ncbi:MAG: protein ImuB [Pseudohongiellaceae bacterium]